MFSGAKADLNGSYGGPVVKISSIRKSGTMQGIPSSMSVKALGYCLIVRIPCSNSAELSLSCPLCSKKKKGEMNDIVYGKCNY